MIQELIDHANSLGLQCSEVLECRRSSEGGVEPDCIVGLREFFQRWGHALEDADEGEGQLQKECTPHKSRHAFIGLIHADGIALYAFEPMGVSQ